MPAGPRARQLSLGISAAAFLTFAAVGLNQLAKDGSFWLDEASLALSLIRLGPLESFGPLVGDQSFSRFYLLAVRGLVAVFGYHTLVVRLLPHVFFLAATFAWLRLLAERFRSQPVLVALGALLLAVPATWPMYGAMFKSYSLDVFASTVPFLLRDDFYSDTLGRGRRPWRLLLLAGLGALSYPFAMVLLARVGGWWLQRAATGARRVDPRAAGFGLLGMSLAAVWIWGMELRHTSEIADALARFWGACLVGSGDVGTWALLDRLGFGWFDGRTEFTQSKVAAVPMLLLKTALAAGLARIAIGVARRAGLGLEAPEAWGSRSLGCAGLLAGLPLASWLLGYPICSGRLTLFALLPIVVVILEGVDAAGLWIRRAPGGHWAALLAGSALCLAILPASVATLAAVATQPTPEDLRPLLARTRAHPDLPILTTTCTRRQIETLPEGIPAELLYVQDLGGIVIATRERPEAWFLFIPAELCSRSVVTVRRRAVVWEPHHAEGDRARLYRVRFPKRRQPRHPTTP